MSSQLQATSHMFAADDGSAPNRKQAKEAEMRQLLRNALVHLTGDVRAQGLAHYSLGSQARLGNVAVFDWLKAEFYQMFLEEFGHPAQATRAAKQTIERIELMEGPPYKCTKCPRTFATLAARNGHQKSHRHETAH